jgi:competence protein ComEC
LLTGWSEKSRAKRRELNERRNAGRRPKRRGTLCKEGLAKAGWDKQTLSETIKGSRLVAMARQVRRATAVMRVRIADRLKICARKWLAEPWREERITRHRSCNRGQESKSEFPDCQFMQIFPPPCLLLVFAAAFAGSLFAQDTKPTPGTGKFILTVLNIPDVQRGAGLAIVMQTPGGKTWLYDTGSGYPGEQGWVEDFNAGRDLIAPFLKERGITALDGVLISHAHYDHFGGLIWLKDNFPIKRLIDSGYDFPGSSTPNYSSELRHYSLLRAEFQQRGTPYFAAHAGDKLVLDDQLNVEVIAPPKDFFSNPDGAVRAPNDPPAHYLVNANSLGIRIQHGNVVFYLPGDIQSEDIDRSLLPFVDPAKIKCHVLIAPGHGIHGSVKFAEATRPEVSIASVFPRYARGLKSTPELRAVGARTYITGLNGWVRVTSDGKTYITEAEHPDTP